MTEIWLRAALWLGLALAATLMSIRLRVATALSEIVVGAVARLLVGVFAGSALPGASENWVTFLSSAGAVFLTFLAGAELDPIVLRVRWRETGIIGAVSFAAPFVGCAAYARWFALLPICLVIRSAARSSDRHTRRVARADSRRWPRRRA